MFNILNMAGGLRGAGFSLIPCELILSFTNFSLYQYSNIIHSLSPALAAIPYT